MNLLKNKKFKYGALGVGLTAALLALLVIFNIIFSALAGKFNWYFDMTSENLYNISDTSKEYLDRIDPEYNDVTIYFFAPADKLTQAASTNNRSGSSSLWGMKYIYSLANELADRYDFINVDHLDLKKDPDKLREIIGESYYSSVSFAEYFILIDNYTVERLADGNVIIGVDKKPVMRHNFRVFSRDSFYAFDYNNANLNVDAFKGDYRFTAAITALCREDLPVAYLISGHGEKIGPYTVGSQNNDFGNAQYFCQILVDCGFRIEKIDLQHEDFDSSKKNALAIIYSPETDFGSNREVKEHNELGKLSDFLSGEGRGLMVMLDYGTQSLPGLEGFLKTNCGITVENAQLKDNGENAVDVNMQQIVGRLNAGASGAAGELAKRLSDRESVGKAIFPSSRPLILDGSAGTDAVYSVPSSAKGVYGGERSESYPEGSAALAALTKTESGAHIFTLGTSYSADVYFADNALYSDRDMFIGAIDAMVPGNTPFNIEYKVMTGEGLDLTKRQSTAAMILISAVIPAAVLLTGTVVYIRRRHS